MKRMIYATETPRTNRSRDWIWWAVLAFLALGLPQCSILVLKAISLISFGNSVNLASEFMVSYAIYGVATALSFVSCLVILAAILLRGGSRWKRFAMAAGFLTVDCFVIGLVQVCVHYQWIGYAVYIDADYDRVIAHLSLSPALSFASIVPAAVMQFFGGWTIIRGAEPAKLHRVNLPTLFEWVLVSSLLFALARFAFVAQYQLSTDALFYEAITLILPAIALGLVSMVLFRGILSGKPSMSCWKLLMVISLIHAIAYAVAVVALQSKGEQMSPILEYSIAPLTICLTGTLHAAAVIYCFKRLGYRLQRNRDVTRGTASLHLDAT